MTSIEEVIDHYQRSINKSLNDETRILHCLNKLYKLPISVQHLQETGIGRTVNSLRKYDGEVGVAAKALVSKWKNVVASEQSDDEEKVENKEDEKQPPPTSHHDEDSDDDQNMNDKNDIVHHENSEDNQNDYSDQEMLYIEEPKKQLEEENKLASTSSLSSHHHSSSSHHRHSSKSTSSKHHSSKETSSKSSHHVNSSKEQHHKDEKARNDKKDKESSHHKDKNKDYDNKEGKHAHHSKSSWSHSSNHHKSSPSSSSSNHSHTKHSSSSSSKKDSKDKEIDEAKSRHGSSSPEKENDKSRHEKVKKDKDKDKEKSKKRDKDRSKDKKSSSSSKKKQHDSGEDETGDIDFSMGGSFADALALMDGKPSSSKVSSAKKPTEKVKIIKIPSSTPSSSKEKSSSASSSSRQIKNILNLDEPPQLLVQKPKLEPLPDIIKDISEPSLQLISPNYRPMPLNQTVMECVFQQNGRTVKRQLTEEEALGVSITSKKARTKVYSGVKSTKIADVPSLYEMCIRLLQDYIDSLDYTGGVPYYILKPVLERCSPRQLENLEYFNPYLTDESDELWEQHCKRKFKGKKREEHETWREMFLRCQDEQDIKLKSLTQNIKQNQEAASLPIKKTQLAYVDSAVKPPRNIISKQQRFGTDRIKIVSPAARVASLQNTGNVTKAGDVKMRIPQGVRDTAHAHVFQPMKPRKAPLMQKSLALMKGRFKR